MTSVKKHIVFDCIGTLVSYSKFFQALEDRLGDRLRAEGVKPLLLGFAWIEAAEREYTYLSVSGKYLPFMAVFTPLFYRMLWMAGIEEPRKFANDADNEYIIKSYTQLEMRPGAKECIEILREGGFTVWGYTAGDLKRVGGYFEQAGIPLPAENLLSCDSYGIGKPARESYTPVLEKLSQDAKPENIWFAAAHMWDVSAAKRSGFRGAWSAVWEKEPCLEIFGEPMDVMAETLPEMARKVVQVSE